MNSRAVIRSSLALLLACSLTVGAAGKSSATAFYLTLNGHVHLFEAISFKSDHPAVFVTGNAGSALALPLPATLSADDPPAPGAVVDEFFSHGGFGFLTMERIGEIWRFTEWDRAGKAALRCDLAGRRTHCVAAEQ